LARPQKDGLDYFPLDTEMDDKVKLIDAKFGVTGFGVLVKIWQIIYDSGYYIKWTEKELLLYKTRINADINLINDVINECLRWGIFNNELYETYSILTSSGIQKRFFEATKRRIEIGLVNEFIIVHLPQNYKPMIKLIPAVIVCKNSKNVDSGTQRKEKKRKVKKSINISSSEHVLMAEKLKALMLINNPGAKIPDDLTNWQIEFERMTRIDKRTPEQINAIIEFSQKDLFWKSNILSAGKLREKFDTLLLQKDRPKQQIQSKMPQAGNFPQRKYTDDEFDKMYKEV
jgi:hypothetical protein